MQQPIDSKIQQAQRKGAGVYVLSGFITVTILMVFALWLFFVKGFSVAIGPNEAKNNASLELVSGFAWVGQANIYTLGGQVSVRVSAPTFEDTVLSINNQSPRTIEVLLRPSPALIKGQAILAENTAMQQQYQAQTQWFIDDALLHVGETFVYNLAPGDYKLTVTNPYFTDVSQDISLVRAQILDIAPKLGDIHGEININSIPQGVSVSINNMPIGQTPVRFSAQGGEYEVTLSSDEYITINETIGLKTNATNPTRNYQLQAKPGVLDINATPNDGVLLINNVEYPLGVIELAANKSHNVQYTKPGHTTYTKTIKVNKDAPTAVNVQLEPLYGEVTITTNVPATISINSSQKQTSPVVKRLLAISHSLEVSAPGYVTQKRNFMPQAKKKTNIDITLLSEFEARQAQGKPLFANTLGINLRKFTGDAYTLGSPVNETGRRRNEHQVEVDFSRRFWVSEKEITQAQFSTFLGANSKTNSRLPVTGVTWLEAAKFCNWLSLQEGLPLFYRFQNGRYLGPDVSSNGYRLPTEAEWEWLAKKAKRAQSTVYVWGNQEKLRDNIGNFADKTYNGKQLIFFDDYTDGKTGLAEVGSFKADRVGLYDLDGNVSEWVHDFYTNGLPDMSKRHIDYLGAPKGDSWVIKGGNYETGRLRELRAAFREFSSSSKATVGFRIARYDQTK